MKIVIEIPDHLDVSFLKLTRNILDTVEFGASTHCLHWPHGWMNNSVEHYRLGVTIAEDPIKFEVAS